MASTTRYEINHVSRYLYGIAGAWLHDVALP